MKKTIALLLVAITFTACKKEAKTAEEDFSQETVTYPESNEITEPATPFVQVEWSPVQTAEMLAAKNNDTLYVTNFFATWCGPCMREIPHFKEKMEELKDQPVKFTFIGLDPKEDWGTKVKTFAEENNLSENIVLLNGELLTPEFFPANFNEWDGGSIPFTLMKKGDRTDETIGMMSKQMLDSKIASFR
ncbi:TlpA family protein disulfide reductase [Chryseobacterium sp. MFBS3-17]|uniref:TlpA family protein disulfide reductase n=1 Tax=Chryseobacterium sp. MFBS3-17 TaxID=2886689 RepID=UPI001D0F2C8B|nr:TlpA disulfide reductase family protein [Chryseobacterium sp. MFBS3-17]MCC2591708.1 TlpA family protein disulfide reductase [Chryseobacterium sp. MFBS3-17]